MIKDLPTLDKPREKAIYYGVENLSDAELLAILIRTGTKSKSALEIAQQIIKEQGYFNTSVITLELLSKIKGLGQTKAITILSAIELGRRSLKTSLSNLKILNSKDIFVTFKYYFINQKQELLIAVFLDANRRLIAYKKIYIGTNNHLNLSHHEIFKEALLHASTNVILLHNHPNGSVYPSKEDIKTTKKLKELGKILDINIIDHIIMTDDNYYSFLDNGDIL